MANYNDTELIRFSETAWQRTGEEADALFGPEAQEPSNAELEIIFSPQLNFTAKMAQLRVLRGESVKPRSFDKRLTDADYLHARALGINLEDEMERGRR